MLKFTFNLKKIIIVNLVLIILSQFSFAQEKKKIETQEHFEKIMTLLLE